MVAFREVEADLPRDEVFAEVLAVIPGLTERDLDALLWPPGTVTDAIAQQPSPGRADQLG